jgi:diguanylate cyclase (GGDEF)-like protein/PAS domain S-box-containing protein
VHGEQEGEKRLRAALEAARDAVVVTDADGIVIEANASAFELSGLAREEAVGRSLLDLARDRDAAPEEIEGIRAALSGAPGAYPAVRRTHSGRRVTVTVTTTPLPGGGATFVSSGLGTLRESHSRAQRTALLTAADRALARPQDLDATLEVIAALVVPEWADSLLVALADDECRLTVVTLATADPAQRAATLALMPAQWHDAPAGGTLDLIAQRGEPVLVSIGSAALAEESRAGFAALGVHAVIGVPLRAHGELVGVLCAGASVPERQFEAHDVELFGALGDRAAQAIREARLHEALLAAEARFRGAFEHAPIGIAISRADPDGTVRYVEVNPALCVIAGYPRESLVGRPVDEFTHPDDREGETRRLRWLLDRRVEEVTGEKRIVRPDGEVRWVHVSGAPLGDGSYVAQLQDITERRRFEAELEHMASHDALTGVLNRRRFEEELEQALAHVRRHGDHAAVLTLDVDNFKHVNDTYGHAAGDDVLRAAAEALQARLRETDQIGRLGGDEFGVILARTEPEAAATVARELLDGVRAVRIAVGEREVRVTASAGLRALAPSEPTGAGALLSEADLAMYDAKERGRDRLSVVRPGDLAPARIRERIRWSERIRDALEHDGFVLYEQPILRLADDVIDRSELLIRLVGEGGEAVLPEAFLGVAERFGQIQAIDRWVVRNAVRLLARRGGTAAVEVNLSGDTLSDAATIDFIAAELSASALDPARLIFEVTETSAISSLDRARGLAERLTGLGCGFALDDFGAGFGSFAYLKHLPLDIIKIDGQFVRGLRSSHADQVTVRAIVDVARGLGKETVAECVEDAETLELLRELGVDRAQGYFIGRPRPASVVVALGR